MTSRKNMPFVQQNQVNKDRYIRTPTKAQQRLNQTAKKEKGGE